MSTRVVDWVTCTQSRDHYRWTLHPACANYDSHAQADLKGRVAEQETAGLTKAFRPWSTEYGTSL